MASAESSPLMSFDHVKAAVTEFGMILTSYFFHEFVLENLNLIP
jgi:hypothetical protein